MSHESTPNAHAHSLGATPPSPAALRGTPEGYFTVRWGQREGFRYSTAGRCRNTPRQFPPTIGEARFADWLVERGRFETSSPVISRFFRDLTGCGFLWKNLATAERNSGHLAD
jgi:hypothetical protein